MLVKEQELQPFPPLVARQHPSQYIYIWPLPPLNKGRGQPSASPSEAPSREVLQEYPTETRILATSEKGTPAAAHRPVTRHMHDRAPAQSQKRKQKQATQARKEILSKKWKCKQNVQFYNLSANQARIFILTTSRDRWGRKISSNLSACMLELSFGTG